MNLGIDFHDTFTYSPQFFIELINSWNGKVYIITGTPEKDKDLIENSIKSYGIYDKIEDILMGYNYNKQDMDITHFNKMAKHKLNLIQQNNILVYFDDNPFYASFFKRSQYCSVSNYSK